MSMPATCGRPAILAAPGSTSIRSISPACAWRPASTSCSETDDWSTSMRTCASALLLVALALPAAAQTPADARWSPWLGCWELTVENVRDDDTAAVAGRPTSGDTRGDT